MVSIFLNTTFSKCQLGTLIAKTVCPGTKQCARGQNSVPRAQPNYTPDNDDNDNDDVVMMIFF